MIVHAYQQMKAVYRNIHTPKFSPLLNVTLVLAYGSPVSNVATTTAK